MKWKPLSRAVNLPMHKTEIRKLKEFAASKGQDPNTIDDMVAEMEKGECWMNDLYTVQVRRGIDHGLSDDIEMHHLSIRRNDRTAAHDWRHMQWIKNEIVGPECEAVEIYPSEKRVVDTANQFHLWCFADPKNIWPFGWMTSMRTDDDILMDGQQRSGSGGTRKAECGLCGKEHAVLHGNKFNCCDQLHIIQEGQP